MNSQEIIDEVISKDEAEGLIGEKDYHGQCIFDGEKLVTEEQWQKEGVNNGI